MNQVLIVASQEIRNGLRNRWVVATTLLLAGLALSLAFLGSAPTGTVGVDRLTVTVVSLASLSIFLLPLVALLLSHDAIVGEAERGTLLLLLAYPIRRWQILLGKFTGHVAILAFATLLGYGAAAVAVVAAGGSFSESGGAFLAMMGSSVLLGAVFLALGYLASTLVRERATAAGVALAVWLVFVVLFDLALLGALVAVGGKGIPVEVFNALLMLNPADVYRLFNLTSFGDVQVAAGMAGVPSTAGLPPVVLLLVLVAWTLVPLAMAGWLFRRREL